MRTAIRSKECPRCKLLTGTFYAWNENKEALFHCCNPRCGIVFVGSHHNPRYSHGHDARRSAALLHL